LLISRSFDLSAAVDASLTFYHIFATQMLSGFCAVDLFDGNRWATHATFDGLGPVNYTRFSLNLSDYINCDDFRFRFRFNSDEKSETGSGWFIDDVLLTVKAYSEITIHGPDKVQTVGILQQGKSQQVDWNYSFSTVGEHIIRITTLLPSDENLINDILEVRITIVSILNVHKNHAPTNNKHMNIHPHIPKTPILKYA
jgi:hypothetical protein